MKKLNKIFIIVSALLYSVASYAQSSVDIRINEVQPYNTEGITDENGERCGWIELFNTAYGMVDVAGFYLTDDKANPTKYMIPKGNVATVIKLRQYFVLYADGNPSKGVFHTNFTLDGVNALYLFDTDGKTLIDEIHLPHLAPNQSYGRYVDGEGAHEPIGWSKRSLRKSADDRKIAADGGFRILSYPTPGATNSTDVVETKSEKMAQIDPYGIILAITAMSVVFLGLIILYVCFRSIGKRAEKKLKAAAAPAKSAAEPKKAPVAAADSNGINPEVVAAIAIACHLYEQENDQVHDHESDILTIKPEFIHNSPWGAPTLTLKRDPEIINNH